MTSVINNVFLQSLATDFVWRLLSTMGTHFSDEDLALCLMKQIKGSGLVITGDDVYVINDHLQCRAVVQNIRHPHSVKHFQLYYYLPLNDSIKFSDTKQNLPNFSFDFENVRTNATDELGKLILGIWNERITDVRRKFAVTRTVILIKSEDFSTFSIFEDEALRYIPDDYYWEWNSNGNLEGYERSSDIKRFTWQPHGSQFTVIANVPENRLKLRIRKPEPIDRDGILKAVKFDPSWVEIVK